jgi:hypothetical protein
MGLLRGRRSGRADDASDADDGAEVVDAEETDDADDADPGAEAADVAVAGGEARRRPLDETEAGDDTTLPRLDLGGMRIPVLPDMEVRIELNEQRQPVAATILQGGGALQVLAFAAPRSSGIWDDVRAEIAESVRADGGQADEVAGRLGTELHAQVRTEQPGQFAEQRLRFVGFDGPRWFLRGVFSGAAVTDAAVADVLETVLTSVVVVRGTDPMAPRDALPLRLPTDVAGMPEPPEPQPPRGIDPFVRGPEITEIQ